MLAPNIGVIDNREDLGPWLDRMQHGHLAVDTETTGLRWTDDLVGGLCLASGETAIYAYKNALGPAVCWLADQVKAQRDLLFHHAKFDMHQLESTFGLRIMKPPHDTKIISFLENNLVSHSLKDLAAEHIDPRAKQPQEDLLRSIKANGGKKGEILWGTPHLVGRYGAYDAWYTLQLFPILLKKLSAVAPCMEGMPTLMDLYENERWLILALRDMEQRGVLIDPSFLKKWENKLVKEQKEVVEELEYLSGANISWTSAPQISELLFETMELKPTKMTPKNKPSTDESALLKLNHPIGAVLLRFRDIEKQRSTYATGLYQAICSDGRIHTTFKQDGARTGRMSSEKPNVQQVPRESGARKAFIPDPGLHFFFGDYSQIEMRFAAIYSRDETLCDGFNNIPNFDTHGATAMKMWGMSSIDSDNKKRDKRRRKFAKILNFGILFGAGEDNITLQLIGMLGSKEAKHSIQELGKKPLRTLAPHRQLARLLLEVYFREFASVKSARRDAATEAKQDTFTTNLFGRRRYLEYEAWYKAFNTKIQGSAADQAKVGLVNLYKELQLKDESIALIMQIHDEAVWLGEPDPMVQRKAIEILNDTTSFSVPIVAELEWSSTNWQEKKKGILDGSTILSNRN